MPTKVRASVLESNLVYAFKIPRVFKRKKKPEIIPIGEADFTIKMAQIDGATVELHVVR